MNRTSLQQAPKRSGTSFQSTSKFSVLVQIKRRGFERLRGMMVVYIQTHTHTYLYIYMYMYVYITIVVHTDGRKLQPYYLSFYTRKFLIPISCSRLSVVMTHFLISLLLRLLCNRTIMLGPLSGVICHAVGNWFGVVATLFLRFTWCACRCDAITFTNTRYCLDSLPQVAKADLSHLLFDPMLVSVGWMAGSLA